MIGWKISTKRKTLKSLIYIHVTENNHLVLLSPSNHTGEPQEDNRLSFAALSVRLHLPPPLPLCALADGRLRVYKSANGYCAH